jgi:hypothetical protein
MMFDTGTPLGRLLYQVQDILPAVGIVVVACVVGLLVGVVLNRVRAGAVRAGHSRPARALRALALVPADGRAGATTGSRWLVGTLVGEGTCVEPITQEAGFLAVVVDATEAQRAADGGRGHRGRARTVDVPVHHEQRLASLQLRVGAEVYAIDGADVVVAAGGSSLRRTVRPNQPIPVDLQRWADGAGVSLTLLGLHRDVDVDVVALRPGDEVGVAGVVVDRGGVPTVVGAAGLPVVVFAGDLARARQWFEARLR